MSIHPLSAATIVFDAADSGWYASFGHTPANENFFVGANLGEEFRDFFLFDLASQAVPGNILSVTLQVQNVPLDDTAPSPQGGEFYEVFDVGSSIADLVSGAASFGDLGTGTSFGMTAVAIDGTVNQLVSVVFNMDGRSAVAGALGGQFAVSGIINSIGDGSFLTDGEDLFEGPNMFDVGATTRQLVIETDMAIPEPSTILLLGTGLFALAALARRRRT